MNIPMERPSQNQIVIDAQFIETFCKIALKNEPSGFIDYDESKYDPVDVRGGLGRRGWIVPAYIATNRPRCCAGAIRSLLKGATSLLVSLHEV
jgi:hypothetical protein